VQSRVLQPHNVVNHYNQTFLASAVVLDIPYMMLFSTIADFPKVCAAITRRGGLLRATFLASAVI
jgi:hypothetical protein